MAMGNNMVNKLASAFAATWLVLGTLTLTAQRPSKAEQKSADYEHFTANLYSPLTGKNEIIISTLYTTRQQQMNAFSRSSYDYWDARVLSEFWGQSTWDSKLRIGRKILIGQHYGDLNNTLRAINQTVSLAQNRYLRTTRINDLSSYRLYQEGYTYNDAVLLALLWNHSRHGRQATAAEIRQSKYRIDQNLARGNNEYIDQSLQTARRLYNR